MPFQLNSIVYTPFWVFCFWLIALGQLKAQDLIVLRSGEQLNVQILGITKDAIAFRHPNVPADSISALPIVALQQIQYANGLEQHFFLPDEDQKKLRRIQNPSPTKEMLMDTLVLRDGNVEPGKVLLRRRFSIDIAKQLGKMAETIPLSKVHAIRYAGAIEEQIWPLYSAGNPFLLGQDYDYLPPHFLALQSGIGLPVGAFADTDNQNPNSGFATAGIQLSFSVFFRLYNGWGLYLNGQRSSNPYNNGGLRQKLSDLLEATGFSANGPVRQTDWIHHTLLIGPSYYLHRGRWMGNLNLGFGCMFTEAPLNQIEGNLNGTPVQLLFIRESKPSPTFSVGMDLRYFFHPSMQGMASLQFTAADIRLGSTQERVSGQSPSLPPATGVYTTQNTNAPLNLLSFQLGLLFALPLP